MVTFKKSTDFSTFSLERVITIPIDNKIYTENQYLFGILHELGHIHYKTPGYDAFISESELIEYEIEAWEYAFRCVQSSSFKEEMKIFSKKCISTYIHFQYHALSKRIQEFIDSIR